MSKNNSMNSNLKSLAKLNEVRIDNYKRGRTVPSYFYTSLRNAFSFYFKTFITNNASYETYIFSTSTNIKKSLQILERQFLDDENTTLCIISFERFFELFLKDLLSKTHIQLSQTEKRGTTSNSIASLIQKIHSKTFVPQKKGIGNNIHKIPFRLTIQRFYDLLDYSKATLTKDDKIAKKFQKVISKFIFLDNIDCRETFDFLNIYRDKILHNGNQLPTLRFLDLILTQNIIPIAKQILEAEETIPHDWLFFTKTQTGINILQELTNQNFEARNSKSKNKVKQTFDTLLYIGHLKELGRANMTLKNSLKYKRSAYEYNYTDPDKRGIRFAAIEKRQHENAKEIRNCPCCGIKSLVYYRIDDEKIKIFDKRNIEWIKCYTCDYHLRYNVLDLHYFDAKFKKQFEY